MIMLVGAAIVEAATCAIVVLCKSRKTGNKSNADDVETNTSDTAATASDGELSKELSSLDITSSESNILDRNGKEEPSLEEDVVKLSGKSSRKRNKKKSALKESKNVIPDVDTEGNVSSVPSANSEKEERSSIPEEQAASLEAKYLEQGARPKVRQRTSIKQTKTGEKASTLQSSVKSSSQKSAKTQDIESETSGLAVKISAKAEGVSDVEKGVSRGKSQSGGVAKTFIGSTVGTEGVDEEKEQNVESENVTTPSSTVVSKSSISEGIKIGVSANQVKGAQSLGSGVSVCIVEGIEQATNIGVTETTSTLLESKVSDKLSRKNRKKLRSKGLNTIPSTSGVAVVTSVADVGADAIATATAVTGAGVTSAAIEPVEKQTSSQVVSQECQSSGLYSKYLRQGARPKVHASKIASSTGDVSTKTSDIQESAVASSVAMQEKPGLKDGVSAAADIKDTQETTQVLSAVKVISSKHMVFNPFLEQEKEYLSLEEYTKKVEKFKIDVAAFASMHIEYCINAIFGAFTVERGKLIVKPRIKNKLLSLTKRAEMCCFMLKISALDHWLSRVTATRLHNNFKYCASHWDDQSEVDTLLRDLLKLGAP